MGIHPGLQQNNLIIHSFLAASWVAQPALSPRWAPQAQEQNPSSPCRLLPVTTVPLASDWEKQPSVSQPSGEHSAGWPSAVNPGLSILAWLLFPSQIPQSDQRFKISADWSHCSKTKGLAELCSGLPHTSGSCGQSQSPKQPGPRTALAQLFPFCVSWLSERGSISWGCP